MKDEYLFDWLFHYNPYEKFYAAFQRQDKEKYFNGEEGIVVLKSTQLPTLFDILYKIEGDPRNLEKHGVG